MTTTTLDPISGDYSFAAEYEGPPVSYELPRAIPIDLAHIPVGTMASPTTTSSTSHLPVVQPLKPSLPLTSSSSIVVTTPPSSAPPAVIVESPTSVIENHHSAADHSSELNAAGSEPESEPEPDNVTLTLTAEPRKTLLLTFQSSPSTSPTTTHQSNSDDEVSTDYDDVIAPVTTKKGGCWRCGRGNRFTDKEACLACEARYCGACVLRAMGSMPEGRKCVRCIGKPIQEARRDGLGKSSRMLRKLLSAIEVEMIMKVERECEANQLRPEDVFVNGERLSQEEMVLLRSCPCPPAKLRPGYYWYDKVSGFWGKEGHRPHKIITPNLNVGGLLDQRASNGNTGVLINGREITKAELKMLKLAGVQCAGKPHFWVNADGSYQEEGQRTVKGKIWDKPIVRLLGPVLSLPTPSKSVDHCAGEATDIVNRVPDYLTQKLLLVGPHGSGKSTILKQAKFLYKSIPFSLEEHEDIKFIIQSNVYNYLCVLLEGRERFEEESLAEKRKNSHHRSFGSNDDESHFSDEATEYSIVPRLKGFSDWLLKVMASGNLEAIFPAATREYAPLVEELWKDAAIQATYRRRNELPFLPSTASYFLERVVDISRTEYEPSDVDIIYIDGITSSNGLAYMDFSFPTLASERLVDDDDQQGSLLRYQLIRIDDKGLGEKCKLLEMFDDVRLVIFCVAASDYDEYYEDANGRVNNRMMESKSLFESISSHPTFERMDVLLLLTKFDILEQKIGKTPLTSCDWFDNFAPLVSSSQPNSSSRRSGRSTQTGATLGQMAAHYIGVKFKRLFFSLTGRKLYVTWLNAQDQESVGAAIRYAKEIVKWEEEKPVFGSSETVYSMEPSSYSQ